MNRYEKLGTLVCLVLLVLVFGFNPSVLARLDVTAVTKEKEAPPGEFVSLVYSVKNGSAGEQDVTFELSVPDRWATMGTPAPATIPAGGKETIFVTVQVPATAKAGDHSVVLRASYDGNTFEGTATVTVKEVKGVEVAAPPAKTVTRDSSLSYVFTVKNTGNITDTFNVEADSGHDWVTNISPETLQLFPGMSKQVKVELYVPADAVPGRDPVTVTATSGRDDDITDKETVFTRILPPSPQAVGGELYAILPARLEGNFSRYLGEGGPTGGLRLVASGELGNGNLNMDFGLSDIYTENDFEWNSFDYGEENFQISTGDVGYTFSNLLSMSGSGISTTFSRGNFSLSLLDLYPGLENGGGSLSYEDDNVYLSGNIANLDAENGGNALTETVVGRFTREELGEIELEAGYTFNEGRFGLAYQVYGESGFDPFTFEGEAFFIGPKFAGSRSGDKGFRVSQSINAENYDQDLTYAYYYSTANDTQTRSMTKTDRLAANLYVDVLGALGSWPGGKEGRAFNLSGSYEMTDREDTRKNPTLDENTQSFSGSFFYRYDNLDFSVSADEEIRTNNLSGETFESFSFNQSFGFTYKGIEFNALYSSSLTENLTTNETVSTSGTTSFELAKTGSPYIGFSVTKSEGSVDISLDSTINPIDNLELSLLATATIAEGDITIGGSLDFAYEYDLPLAFIITQGRVKGSVFVDSNSNGKKDEGEEGVPELVLTIEDTKVASGKDGYFKFPPLTPGTYEMNISDLPSKYASKKELPVEVKVKKGEETNTLIPLTELSSASLRVFNDANQNGKVETGEEGIEAVGVTLKGDGVERTRSTNQEGKINFRGLVPGSYTLTLNTNTLPPRSEVTTGNTEISIELSGGEEKEINIGSFQRPREIIFGQPPEADFAYAPTEPSPGQEVNFSGGLSTDPDGEIAKYEWDFQSDGKVDRSGKIVSHIFPESGTYEVSLTVTDSDGNDVTVTKEIDVISE